MPTTKRYLLVTVDDAKPVYRHAIHTPKYRCEYRLTPNEYVREVDSTDSSGGQENRERVRLRAEKDVGRALVWVDGGMSEYFDV